MLNMFLEVASLDKTMSVHS